jgi:hypothetical protein
MVIGGEKLSTKKEAMKSSLSSLKLMALTLTLIFSASCGNGLKKLRERGIDGPSFNVLNGQIILTLKLLRTTLPTGSGGELPIPYTSNSSVEIGPNVLDGGTIIQLFLDPDDIKGVQVADDPNTLPDGRPLPGIPGGVLPSLRADTNLWNTTFYFHQKLMGFYVPFHFNTHGLAAYYEVIINGINMGMVGVVKSDSEGRNSGLIVFLRLEALKRPEVEALLERSRRNPHKMF